MIRTRIILFPILTMIVGVAAASAQPDSPVAASDRAASAVPEQSPLSCPTVLPIPADAAAVQCFSVDRNPAERCATRLSVSTCAALISTAFSDGLITPDATAWLIQNGWCPIVANFAGFPQILDFCQSS